LLIEPHAEVVQSYPRRQASPQPAQLVSSFSAKTKSIVELLLNRLHNLANARRPTPEPLGPSPFAPVLSGRADEAHSVEIEPPSVILFALKTLVAHVWSPAAADPTLGALGFGSQRRAKKVSAKGWSLVEAGQKPKPVITPVGL
jgi:hypothetical protein